MGRDPLVDDRLLSDSSRILRPSYLENRPNKNDLIRRLVNVVYVLQNDESIDPDDEASHPGLLALAERLVCDDSFLEDREKEVRLYSLLACLEILGIFAPSSPFSEESLIRIFQKVIVQVGNLAHAVDPKSKNYKQYYRILEHLAHVKTGVVLVELGRTLDDDVELSEDPILLLSQLFHTLFQLVHNDHSTEIHEMVQQAITACLEEYHKHVPIPLMDEVLLALASGPTVWAVNPAAHQHQPTQPTQSQAPQRRRLKEPMQIQVPNPSYMVAAKILKASENHLTRSVSDQLLGLLNGEINVISKSSIPTLLACDGYSNTTTHDDHATSSSSSPLFNIIFELHRVAPSMLTKVIGTVSGRLRAADNAHRLTVVTLLGRVFASPVILNQFTASYDEWLERFNDIYLPIRRAMVKHLCAIIALPSCDNVHKAQQALIHMLADPVLDVRQDAIYEITDVVYRKDESPATANMTVSAPLLRAVGDRIQFSKNSEERRYSMTGLSQLYYKHYMHEKVRVLQDANGGETCDMANVLSVLHKTHWLQKDPHSSSRSKNKGRAKRARGALSSPGSVVSNKLSELPKVDSDDDVYGWIPGHILGAAFTMDKSDPDMRSRLVQIVDEVLLGSELSSKSFKRLTPTARAVGLVVILDSLAYHDIGNDHDDDHGNWFHEDSSSFKGMKQLFQRRAKLQRALGLYLDARAAIRNHETGTTQWMVADAEAKELLEKVADLTAPPAGSASLHDVLATVHGAKDNHIFRLLSTVADPLQTPKSRSRALNEIPKRMMPHGEAAAAWIKNLVRRCNMGDFFNSDVAWDCVRLARECLAEEDIAACSMLVAAAKIFVDIFPALGAVDSTFQALQELLCGFASVRSGDLKQDVEQTGIVTTLTALLKAASQNRSEMMPDDDDNFRKQLMQLCTRDGTPEQANNAVYTLVRLSEPLESSSKIPDSFRSFLASLTSPARLTISEEKSPSVIRVLSALTALADSAPMLFSATEAGKKAIRFALESVLMGNGTTEDSDDDENISIMDDSTKGTPSPRKKLPQSSSKKRKHRTPKATARLVEDENLSYSCRKVCAAIELLVSFVRSSRLSNGTSSSPPKAVVPEVVIKQLFDLLTQIVRDEGLPPSIRDRRLCKARQDRAALRQCAGVHLLRLFDKRVALDTIYLTPLVSHVLSEVFLDDERVVREAMAKELLHFMDGTGLFGEDGCGLQPQCPPLRCFAFMALCSDGDHGTDHDPANGSAANIGNLTSLIGKSSVKCAESLRKSCDVVYLQLRAKEKNAEKAVTLFDRTFKPLLMPEYTVPFVFHLLTHRRETPESDSDSKALKGKVQKDMDDGEGSVTSITIDVESQHRILRKRLKLVFEALVRSLGDDADNIAFLLRMTEILEKKYRPVDALSFLRDASGDNSIVSKRSQVLEAKLHVVCRAAREVLLSLVKKDKNLAPYPGNFLVPPVFVKKSKGGVKTIEAAFKGEGLGRNESRGATDDYATANLSPKPSSTPRGDANASFDFHDSASARKAHFSPDIEIKLSAQQRPLTGDDGKEVSPIAKSHTPTRIFSHPHDSSDNSTLAGSSPPSAFRFATMHSSAPDQSSVETGSLLPSTKPPSASKDRLGFLLGSSKTADAESGELSQITIPSLDDRAGGDGSSQSASSALKPSKASVKQASSSPVDKRRAQRGNAKSSLSSTKRKHQANPFDDASTRERIPKHIKVTTGNAKASTHAATDVRPSQATSPGKLSGLDDLDFDFGNPLLENDPPRRRNTAGTSAKPKSHAISKSKVKKSTGRMGADGARRPRTRI